MPQEPTSQPGAAPHADGAWETLEVREADGRFNITFNRPERENSFNAALLRELWRALDAAEASEACRVVVLEGRGGYFCKGLDLEEGLREEERAGGAGSPEPYVAVLRRLSLLSRIVVSVVDGQAAAGGLGFVAASDHVIATPRASFNLPEAIFGLVPACVGLYLSRRVGPQTALRLSLTLETMNAERARACGLVDEVTESPEASLRRVSLRASRLRARTVAAIKRFYRDIGQIDEERERSAVEETARLMADSSVREDIARFVHHKRFPWE